METTDQPDYLSYLLRLWWEGGEGEASGAKGRVWRASLESPHTGERKGFASLEDVFEFLREQTRAASEGGSHATL